MKTIFIDFEYFSKRKVKTNQAIIKIIPPDGNIEPIIQMISFKEPVTHLYYDQLLALNEEIDKCIMNQDWQFSPEKNKTGLSVIKNPINLAISEKGINGFRGLVENIAVNLDQAGKLNPEEKENIKHAFGLIEKFLGPKK